MLKHRKINVSIEHIFIQNNMPLVVQFKLMNTSFVKICD